MKQYAFLFALVFAALIGLPHGETAITSCQNLSSPNTIYTLGNSVSNSTSTCFNIIAENVTLNCSGYSVTGGNATGQYGVYSNKSNSTVLNCNISGFQHGVFFWNSDNGTIRNVWANTTHDSGFALLLQYRSNRNIVDNFTGYAVNYSILIYTFCNYNLLENSTGYSKVRSGIMIDNNHNNTVSKSNGISGLSYGINFEDALNCTLINSTASSSLSNALCLQETDSVIVRDSRGISINHSAFSLYYANNSYLYNLTANTSAHGAYFRFGKNNVFDCGQATLTGWNRSIGFYSNEINSTIRNCHISNFMYGVYFNGAENGSVENCTINITYKGGRAVYFDNSTNGSSISNSSLYTANSRKAYVSSGTGNSIHDTRIISLGTREDSEGNVATVDGRGNITGQSPSDALFGGASNDASSGPELAESNDFEFWAVIIFSAIFIMLFVVLIIGLKPNSTSK